MSNREDLKGRLLGTANHDMVDHPERAIAAAQALALLEISETLAKLDNPMYIVPRVGDKKDFVVSDGSMCSDCGVLAGQEHGPECRAGPAQEVLEIISTAENRAMATDGAVPPDHQTLSTSELVRFFQAAYRLAKAVV